MNYDDFDLGHSDEELYNGRRDIGNSARKRVWPKMVNTGVPNKPGTWRSLGVRPKYDPETNEPTAPTVSGGENGYTYSAPPLPEQGSVPESKMRGRGRPIGSKNKRKKRYDVDWSQTTDHTYAPIFSPSYLNKTEPHEERYNKQSAKPITLYKNENNILVDIQAMMENTLLKIRKEVMEHCNWSLPTYYRKQRPDSNVSNAESGMIASLVKENMELLRSKIDHLLKDASHKQQKKSFIKKINY